MKKSLKNRVKDFFLKKPKQDVWKKIAILLILFHMFSPTTVLLSIPLQIGLVSPEIEPIAMQESFEKTSNKMVDIYVGAMYRMMEAGQEIGRSNWLIAHIIYYMLSALIYSLYAGILIMALAILRYLISFCYEKYKRRKKS